MCRKSDTCFHIFSTSIDSYIDSHLISSIKTIDLDQFLLGDFVNLRPRIFVYVFSVSHRPCYFDGLLGGIPHGLFQVIACLPSLCFVASLGKGRSEQHRVLRAMEQRQVETEET